MKDHIPDCPGNPMGQITPKANPMKMGKLNSLIQHIPAWSVMMFLLPLTPSLASPDAASENAQASANTTPSARFLRIELPGQQRILTLNEVEILRDGKNIARNGRPTQSSTDAGGVAERGIDGIKDPDWGRDGQTHTTRPIPTTPVPPAPGGKSILVGSRSW